MQSRITILVSLLLLPLILPLPACSLAALQAANAELAKPLDLFMKACTNKNVNAAWQLTSVEFRQAQSKDKLAQVISQEYYLFERCQSLTIKQKTISTGTEGTVARAQAEASYSDGTKGTVNVIFNQEGNEWKVSSVNILVDPSKIQKFYQKDG